MSDAINDALDALNRLKAEQANPAAVSVLESVVKSALSANGGEAVPFAHCYTDVNGKAKELCHPPECASEGDKRVITALYTHPAPPSVAVPEGCPDDIRALGLSVAVHNDYRLNGEHHTFWLFTDETGMSYKGEGRTDAEALNKVRAILAAAPSPDHIADAGKVAFVDGLGAQRMTADECKEGIEYIIHGDNIYWPLSDDDELRLIQAACGKGEFTYPGATPSVPENEIKAQALEEFARDCGLFEPEYDDQEYIEIPRWRFKEHIARLRASQQEGSTAGDDGEGV